MYTSQNELTTKEKEEKNMGWVPDKYFWIKNAKVDNGTLTISFKRLYRDGRDIMSDCLKPDWEPVDDFIITVTCWQVKVETRKYKDLTRIQATKKKIGEFEVLTRDKKIANLIWYLGEKKKLDFQTLARMNKEERFK